LSARTARWRRRLVRLGLLLLTLAAAVLGPPVLWTVASSTGHLYTVDSAPAAPVGIVFGAQLRAGGHTPKAFLLGRLVTAVRLYQTGKVRALLVSGDAHGDSGNEVAVMTRYLTDHGVPAERVVADPYGLDSYDTCRRARDVYGVNRALLISQRLHLYRAVTLCRHTGMSADGVGASCDECQNVTLAFNSAREVLADIKAVRDVWTDRKPAVTSPPDPAVTRAASP
jgi:vancomycin permeability regulator SanA